MTSGNLKSEATGSKFRARETTFDGVNVRLYEPISASPDKLLPAFIFFHGGGWCLGDIRIYDGLTRKFADELGAVVVSVGYRLSPEFLRPNSFEDSFRATKWFITQARDYGVDSSRVAIGGDSGGGTLAALVANRLLDEKDLPRPKAQLLVYPSIQNLDVKTPSQQKYHHHFGCKGVLPLTRQARMLSYIFFGKKDYEFEQKFLENNHTSSDMKKSSVYDRLNHSFVPEELKDSSFYRGPTGKQFGDDKTWQRIEDIFHDPGVGPFVRKDLRGLPPTFVQTCDFDSIRDDGIFYWSALRAAGVDATWRNYESGFHGIFWLGGGILEFELGVIMRKHAFDFLRAHIYIINFSNMKIYMHGILKRCLKM
ncbi:arylacetamide deacetylase-like isoform X3 [Apostichopus japonicus]